MLLEILLFQGISPRIDPRRIANEQAQVAVNCDFRSHELRTFFDTAFTTTPAKVGTKQTIYRFGQNVTDETLYWFHWLDDVDCVKGQIAADTEEHTYFVGDSANPGPRWTKSSLALTGTGTAYPLASYPLGIPIPAGALTGTVTGTGSGTVESRAYIYTYVGSEGEEGPPSNVFMVNMQDGQTVTLSNFSAPPAGYNIPTIRIYRVATGNATATYRLVAELPSSTTSYADSVLDVNLGYTLQSLNWYAPPSTIRGFRNLPNGVMAGFDGNDVLLCEAFRPYAWPPAYRQPTDFPVVGLGVYGDTLVIGTKGNPYILFGNDPNSMTLKRLDIKEACASKRSIVELGYGVMYASYNGLVLVGGSGADVATAQIIDKKYWNSLNPASMSGYQYDGKYVGFYNNGTPGGFIFDPTGDGALFTLLDVNASAGYNDIVRDALYLQIGNDIRRWEAATTRRSGTWRSRIFELTHATNFRFGQIRAQSYPLTFTLYGDGTQRYQLTVLSDKPFALPRGYMATEIEMQIDGAIAGVSKLSLAHSMEELRDS